jgi:hypothetical protein
MTRRDGERLADIVASAVAIALHLERGDLDDGLVFDAVRVRLIEIGESKLGSADDDDKSLTPPEQDFVAGGAGLEPATSGSKVRCSAS